MFSAFDDSLCGRRPDPAGDERRDQNGVEQTRGYRFPAPPTLSIQKDFQIGRGRGAGMCFGAWRRQIGQWRFDAASVSGNGGDNGEYEYMGLSEIVEVYFRQRKCRMGDRLLIFSTLVRGPHLLSSTLLSNAK
jgi:hypothetical protein